MYCLRLRRLVLIFVKMKQKRLKVQLKLLIDEKGLDIDAVFELIIRHAEYGA
ncbi:putative transposase (Fragment) [Neisseria meningitidis FAM18]|uniref:Transposase n=1 Tax=Neisseria meningitidis serogroup C / serotype 2a (strain ATCC 700532 / DSM 15464 / FAM18) TaxID=272831 RepID=A1KU32_NEIMF